MFVCLSCTAFYPLFSLLYPILFLLLFLETLSLSTPIFRDALKIKVENALHEIYEVQVSQINSRLKRTAQITDSIILIGSLIGAFQTGGGSIPALAGIAATAVTVARGVKPFFEYENQIRQNPAFFIWKALDESKKFTWAD